MMTTMKREMVGETMRKIINPSFIAIGEEWLIHAKDVAKIMYITS
jgi:hypothetical protein